MRLNLYLPQTNNYARYNSTRAFIIVISVIGVQQIF